MPGISFRFQMHNLLLHWQRVIFHNRMITVTQRAFFWAVSFATCLTVSEFNSAWAQSELINMAPARYVSTVRMASDIESIVLLAGIERSIPLGELLPQVSPDSYIEFMRIHAGIRSGKDADIDLRAHVTAVSFEIQKMPWAAAFSVLDVKASEMTDLNADWLALAMGPGIDFGSRQVRFVARILAGGALNSSRFGSSNFPELGKPAGNTRHTLVYGLKGRAAFVVLNRASIAVKYDLNWYAIDADLTNTDVTAVFDLRILTKLWLTGSYRITQLKIKGDEENLDVFRFGVVFTPSETF